MSIRLSAHAILGIDPLLPTIEIARRRSAIVAHGRTLPLYAGLLLKALHVMGRDVSWSDDTYRTIANVIANRPALMDRAHNALTPAILDAFTRL